MGGIGSTRWRGLKVNSTVDECLSFDVQSLVEGGLLASGRRAEGVLSGAYEDLTILVDTTNSESMWATIRGRLTEIDSERHRERRIRLRVTNPQFGGVRWWFQCPWLCSRLRRKLYIPRDFPKLWCRSCHELVYASQQASIWKRPHMKAMKVVRMAGGQGRWGERFPLFKPKGMHQRTFSRLLEEHQATQVEIAARLAAGLVSLRRLR